MRRSSTSTPRTSSTSPPSSSSRVRFTSRSDGDLLVEEHRRAVIRHPCTWLRQVHGARVVTVTKPGGATGEAADAAVTAVPEAALGVRVADCAPVALLSPEGVVGAVHAGWRGLEAGVLPAAADAMRALGASHIEARVGPCIHAECYEFGRADLDRLAARWGQDVVGQTASGAPALDLPAAVRAELRRAGVEAMEDAGICTACSPEHFSHRAAGDTARQGMVVWMD